MVNEKQKSVSDIVGSFKTANSYLVYGNVEKMFPELHESLKHDVDILDISVAEPSGKKGIITIESIREMITETSKTPSRERRYAIVKNAEKLNHVSSNALLKTLEEPNAKLTIILLSNSDQLLETIKSRCTIYDLRAEYHLQSEEGGEAEELIKGSITEGFALIDKIVKDERETEILDSLEVYTYNKMKETKSVVWKTRLGNILKIREDIGRNANKKLALENLIISLKEK